MYEHVFKRSHMLFVELRLWQTAAGAAGVAAGAIVVGGAAGAAASLLAIRVARFFQALATPKSSSSVVFFVIDAQSFFWHHPQTSKTIHPGYMELLSVGWCQVHMLSISYIQTHRIVGIKCGGTAWSSSPSPGWPWQREQLGVWKAQHGLWEC